MKTKIFFTFLLLLLGCSAQFKCPERTGFFPDPVQCDLYYICSKGQYEEKLCPDGLVFDDTNPNKGKCDIPSNVDCGDRDVLRLIYDDVESTCSWPAESNRRDCGVIKRDSLEDGFSCPREEAAGPEGTKLPHPTYAHPDDCQKFYICRNGVRPQKGACPYGKVYSEDTYKCEDPKDVPGCENFYEPEEKKPQTRS